MLKSYQKQLAEHNSKPDSTFKKYLTDGQPDIQTEADLQNQMDLIAEALEKSRLFLKKNKASEITVKANLSLIPDLNSRYASSCEIKESESLEYELICPPSEIRSLLHLANKRQFGRTDPYSDFIFEGPFGSDFH